MADHTDYDLCIIGGGAAGLVTAALGAKVLLIEKNRLGGDCLYTGCIPSKTLIHSASIAHTIRTADQFGLSTIFNPVQQHQISQHIAEVIESIEPHDSPERFRKMGVEVLFAEAQFISTNRIRVDSRENSARKYVLATGSRPFIPVIDGLDTVDYLSNETIFNLTDNIEHLLIIGSGASACELAQSFARLAAKVTIISHSTLLPIEDDDMSDVVQQQLIADGVILHLQSTITSVEKHKIGVKVNIQTDGNSPQEIIGTALLMATGRQANIEYLGLDKAKVAHQHGRLILDKRLRTSNKNIFACGDVAGPYLFTHMAEYQAGVVLKNSLFHWPAQVKTGAIPWCTFTNPELARVGLSEREALQQGIKHQIYSFPFSEIDRAITAGETKGMAKIIISPNGKLLGACIVGHHAGELIAEYSLAISQGLTVSALSNTIHIYPTLAQINRRVAELRTKALLTPKRKKWLKRLFGLRA